MSRDLCPVCMVDAGFSMVGGMLHCTACGSLMPDFVEEVQEYEDTQMTRSRAYAGPSQASTQHHKAKQALYDCHQCAEVYARCLQALLKSQIQWLVQNGKVNPGLDSVVHKLWRAYVLRSGLLEPRQPDAARDVAEAADTEEFFSDASGIKADPDLTREDDEEAKPLADSMVTDAKLQEVLWTQAPPRATVELLFVGCIILREALQPCDFVRMIAMSQLPFLNFADVSAPVLTTVEIKLPARVLRPKVIPTVTALLDSAATLASLLGVRLPGINAGALLFRYVTELQLPQALAEAAMALVQVHLLGTRSLHIQEYGHKLSHGWHTIGHPYAHLMAALVVAARLAWGLDGGQAAAPHSAHGMGPRDWQQWATALYKKMDRPIPIPTTPRQALELTRDEWEDYLHYCKSVVFGGLAIPDELKKLDSIVRSASTHLTDSTDNEECGLSSGLDMALQHHRVLASHRHVGARPGADGKDDGVPLEAVGAYTVFWKSRDMRGGVPPNYAALLLMSSRLIWVRTSELHRLVMHLEQRCRDVELHIDQNELDS